MGRLKATIIPIATIPICLLGAICFLYLLGVSLNIIDLLAMVIAVGLVVDDAIVVVENITSLLEKGVSKYQAIIEGTSHIAKTIIGITLTLIAVYLPLLFIDSIIIQIIKPFALTLMSAVFISGIVALTLTPVMAVIFTDNKKPNRYQIGFEKVFKKVISYYHKSLNFVLSFPKSMIIILIIILSISIYVISFLPKTVFPTDPSGEIKVLINQTPSDTSNSLKEKLAKLKSVYQDKRLTYYIKRIEQDPQSGKTRGVLFLSYKPAYLKQMNAILSEVNSQIKKQKLENTYARLNAISNWGDIDLSFYIYSGNNQRKVDQIAQKVTKKLKQTGIFSFVNNTVSPYKKQFDFIIDSAKSEQVGISRLDILNLLSVYYGGYTLNNNFSYQGLSVPIVIKLANDELKTPKSLENITITSQKTGKTYPLSAFVSLKLVARPTNLTSFNNQSAVEIMANLSKGHSLGEAIDEVNQVMKVYGNQVQYQFTDNAKDYLKGNHQSMMIVIFGLVCIYVLLALVFGSLIDPFIILLTVPFSVVGGALSLYLIGGSFNIYSVLGLITLIGLITKHGVLIVQFANTELKRGLALKEAILLATEHRFRPIMMTTLAMIFGALPLLLSSEMMYVSRANLAIVIMGGLVIGTLFSLYVVPLVYELIKSIRFKIIK